MRPRPGLSGKKAAFSRSFMGTDISDFSTYFRFLVEEHSSIW
jgi:hypothetical protein